MPPVIKICLGMNEFNQYLIFVLITVTGYGKKEMLVICGSVHKDLLVLLHMSQTRPGSTLVWPHRWIPENLANFERPRNLRQVDFCKVKIFWNRSPIIITL